MSEHRQRIRSRLMRRLPVKSKSRTDRKFWGFLSVFLILFHSQPLHDALFLQISKAEIRNDNREYDQNRCAYQQREEREMEGGKSSGCHAADHCADGGGAEYVRYRQRNKRIGKPFKNQHPAKLLSRHSHALDHRKFLFAGYDRRHHGIYKVQNSDSPRFLPLGNPYPPGQAQRLQP